MSINLSATAPSAPCTDALSGSSSGNRDQTYHLKGGALLRATLALNFANAVAWLHGLAPTVLLFTIGKDLDAKDIVWAGAAGLVGASIGQMLIGYVSDSFGRRYMILTSLALMFVFTLATGFITNSMQLYVLRGLAGITTGSISNLMNIAISDFMPLEARPKYQGFQGVTVAVGSVVALLGGSALAGTGPYGWKKLFYAVEAPSAFLGLVMCYFWVPSKLTVPTRSEVCSALKTIDYVGAASLSIALATGLIVVSEGGRIMPWKSATTIALIVVACISTVVFLVDGFRRKDDMSASVNVSLTTRQCQQDITLDTVKAVALSVDSAPYAILTAETRDNQNALPHDVSKVRPIVPFAMFRNKTVAVLQLQSLLAGYVYYAVVYLLPVYLQVIRGYSPFQTALRVLPYFITHGLVSWASGLTMRLRYGQAPCGGSGDCHQLGCEHPQRQISYGPTFWVGFAAGTLACGLLILCSRTLNYGWIILCQILFAVCTGSAFQNSITALQAHTRPEDSAVVIGSRNLFRCVGGAIGCSISGAIMSAASQAKLPADLKYLAESSLSRPDMSLFTIKQQDIIFAAFVWSIRCVFIVATIVTGICLVSCLFVKDDGLDGHASNVASSDCEKTGGDVQELASQNKVATAQTDSRTHSQEHHGSVNKMMVEKALAIPKPVHLGWSEESEK